MSNPIMIALIAANPGLAAMSTYDSTSYTGTYQTQEDIEDDNKSVEALANPWVFLMFITLVTVAAVGLTILGITMSKAANERDNQYAAMEQKCVDRGGKLVYARSAGTICVIDIDKPINQQ